MSAEQRTALAACLPGIATVEGRALSVFNACLIASQNPQSTIVGGFRQWIKAGRAVRKGEHGMCIWVPLRQGADSDAEESGVNGDETSMRFILGTVFDVTQTQEIGTQADEAQPSEPVQVKPAGRPIEQTNNARLN